MRVIAVLDLMNGEVVHGKAGRRETYRPIQSALCEGAEPIAIAKALRKEFGISELYVADLNAIAGAPPARELFIALAEDGFSLTVDAGLRHVHDLRRWGAEEIGTIVAGLETLDGPGVLADLLLQVNPSRLLFSLDMKEGVPLGNRVAWEHGSAEAIVDMAVRRGVERMLLLDLARVGMGQGLGTEGLARIVRERYPKTELTLGGGIRQPADLAMLPSIGVDAVLVATLLHRGCMSGEDLRSILDALHVPNAEHP
ncbi:MAG: HisA/HisF-related TIM barrel protein [Planctomycetota bacterium]